jgi:type II secretory pathway pseudopilin PulG
VQAVFVAVIAVVGTLSGAAVTGFIQQRQTARAEERAKDERLRQERLASYLAFAQSISEFNAAQIERWIARTTRTDLTRDSDEYQQAREKTHRIGAVAEGALFRVQLAIDNEGLLILAREALSAAYFVEKAGELDDLDDRAEKARNSVNAFVTAAGRLGQVR